MLHTVEERPVSEREQVTWWREQCLLDAGYPADAVRDLASRRDVDLHAACRLIADGCDPLVAVDILT